MHEFVSRKLFSFLEFSVGMERLFSLHCEIWVKLSSISTLDTPLRPKTSKYPKGVYTSLGVYTSFHYVYGRGAFCGRAKHNRPLYHTGYDANTRKAIGKIRLKCQLGSRQSQVTCYVIETDTSYNLLLGRPWIHENLVVPSTLHQCFKYVGEEGKVHKVFAEKRPFRASESHCADAKMYEQEAEAEEDTNPELVIARKPEVRQKKYMVFINDKTIQPKPKSGKYKVNDVPNPLANNKANR
ncbi:hypothetical protein NE237_007690 [Protea cynaroides]|uniref:Uncharacterized protein n=1 Tax=Protea cynaroides TaxID=273540 RepID=A0A9Q0KHS9_9MAGN|nr:hypothetical protein NE237_003828 [Protea cynaroides]KAJ4974516.1 hypothetical protein NE237_007690 [Protea cynaroides]